MKKISAHIANIAVFALVLSINSSQAQTQPPYTNENARAQEQSAEFTFPALLAQARSERRSGFSFVRASRFTAPAGSVFTITPAATTPNLQVIGSGIIGRLTRWGGLTSNNSIIGDSTIFEDKFGKVGIGTDSPTARLTVAGLIESTGAGGGIKFPDATTQTTAFDPNQVVRSLNGLRGDLTVAAGTNIAITPSGGNTLTISAPNVLTSVSHNGTLAGNGTTASPLGVADGGVGTAQLANNAVGTAQLANNSVTAGKIVSGQVLKGLNGLTDQVVLAAGPNVTIASNGNTLTIGTTTSDPALSAFQKDVNLHIDEGVGVLDTTISIPANKRLVIEYLSISLASPNEANPLLFLTTHIGTNGDVRYLIDPPLVGDRSFGADHLVRIYADGSIQVRLLRIHPDFPSEGTLTISGHLVDLP